MIPYLLMAFLYILVAVLMAVEASFASFGILDWFNGMVWLRIHFITLGVMTQILYGVMPALTARYYDLPRPDTRWDIWSTLNVGIVLLLVGIPLTSRVPIIAGGTFVFISTVLLMIQLGQMNPSGKEKKGSAGRKFYIAGLAYFLVGIIVGTGLFTGWVDPLRITGNATEVHIHANNWGLLSLVFAGLFVDLYAVWAKRPLANPKSINSIFWMMTVGAFGLIFGPWFIGESVLVKWLVLVPGLLLHLGATIWLLVNAIKPLRIGKEKVSIGMWHLISSYFWILAPVSFAPFVVLGIGNLPAATIEGTAPQALIYGWVLQYGMAVVPYFFQRFFFKDENAELGGTKLSLILVNLGSVFLWASIFFESIRSTLHGTAYLLWAIAMIPVVIDLWKKTQSGMREVETAVS